MMLSIFEGDETLERETSLGRRLNVIDLAAFIVGHALTSQRRAEADPAIERLANFRKKLEAINTGLFDRLRAQIRDGCDAPGLRIEFDQYTDYGAHQSGQSHVGPDALDALLDGILILDRYPRLTAPPTSNIIPYDPTPARAILDVVDNADLKADDVFYDLGAGLGRVVIMTHLVSGVKAKGIEISPLHYQRACDYAGRLKLSGVEFINADVRDIEYTDGTVFFMYTPFTGEIFETMLDKLRQEADARSIRICTYGPCTAWVAEQPWLESRGNIVTSDPFRVATFHSRGGPA